MRLRIAAVLFALSFVAAGCKANPAEEIKPADCPAFTEKGRLPATPDDAAAQKQKGTSWSNREIRARYVCWAMSIGGQVEQWKAEGVPLSERAKRAFQARHDARMAARAMMSNAESVRALEARDRGKYGTPDGPTFEWLVKRAEEKGLTGDAVFDEIIASAQRTDAATNAMMGL